MNSNRNMSILGGEMREGYSHTYHAVSELLEAGAPNIFLLDILLATSNILNILFGIGVLKLVQESNQKHRIGIFGASCLIVAGVLGLIITIFLFVIWFKKQADYTRDGTYSLISAIIIIVTGVFAVVMAVKENALISE